MYIYMSICLPAYVTRVGLTMMTTAMMIAIPCLLGCSPAWATLCLLSWVGSRWHVHHSVFLSAVFLCPVFYCISLPCVSLYFDALYFPYFYCNPLYFYTLYFSVFLCTVFALYSAVLCTEWQHWEPHIHMCMCMRNTHCVIRDIHCVRVMPMRNTHCVCASAPRDSAAYTALLWGKGRA